MHPLFMSIPIYTHESYLIYESDVWTWFSYFQGKFYGVTLLQIIQYVAHSKVLSIKDTQ